MNEALVGRVKNSLNKQFYTMNDSWLSDCMEYYLSEHENATQDEIITFVMNQWILCDLREINNEKGCLPRDLKAQKCTTLPGKYILQMDKMYDISTSKYKQLEKIRNVSSENVEATENENAAQEDKFQAWEPKSKRMLQLYLTDGIQDILAIEYKPIRFLKDSLFPGYKLMIKGPVKCRKGVILLEEINIAEIGGEVESLLIVNAVENVFARALNLEENPDPYNDNNKQTQNTRTTVQTEDDFNIDSEALDQIEKQIQQQNFNSNKNSSTTAKNNQHVQSQNISRTNSNITPSAMRSQQSDFQNSSNNKKNNTQKTSFNNKISNKISGFEDDDDLFLEMVDEKTFNNTTALPKPVTVKSEKNVTYHPPSTSLRVEDNRLDEFPTDEEAYDFDFSAHEKEPTFSSSSLQNKPPTKTSSNSCIQSLSSNFSMTNKKTISDASNKNLPQQFSSLQKSVTDVKPSTSCATDFPDDDFDFSDFDLKTNVFQESSNENSAKKSSQESSSSKSITSKLQTTSIKAENSPIKDIESKTSINFSSETKFGDNNSIENFSKDYGNEFEVEFEASVNDFKPLIKKEEEKPITNKSKMTSIKTEVKTEKIANVETGVKRTANTMSPLIAEFEASVNDFKPLIKKEEEKRITDKSKMTSTKTEVKTEKISNVVTGVKRTANTMSPSIAAPQKVRCLQNSPKANKTSNRKITDFLSKPSLICDDAPKIIELIQEVLQKPVTDKGIHTVVRGKVVNVVKLNLLKGTNGSYFHLEGSITDQTGCLDIVFSSEVLEKIIGYSPSEFSQKRKLSKTNASIKNQLVEDLKKAQHTFRVMDALMQLEIKKNEKALVVKTFKLSNEQKQSIDKRVRELKK